MLNIKDFIITNKQILIKDNILKSLFKKNLSSNEINILTSHIRNLLISRNEPIKNLYMYTYHNLDNEFKSHSALLRLQCTANNIYVQYHEDVPYITLNNNTIIFYSNKHLYLDGTLAEYHGWGDGGIGKPIPAMVNRVKAWLEAGIS